MADTPSEERSKCGNNSTGTVGDPSRHNNTKRGDDIKVLKSRQKTLVVVIAVTAFAFSALTALTIVFIHRELMALKAEVAALTQDERQDGYGVAEKFTTIKGESPNSYDNIDEIIEKSLKKHLAELSLEIETLDRRWNEKVVKLNSNFNVKFEKLQVAYLENVTKLELQYQELARALNMTDESLSQEMQTIHNTLNARVQDVQHTLRQRDANWTLNIRSYNAALKENTRKINMTYNRELEKIRRDGTKRDEELNMKVQALATILNDTWQEVNSNFDAKLEKLRHANNEVAIDMKVASTTSQNILSKNVAKLNLTLTKVEELLHSEREKNRDLDEQRKAVGRNQTRTFEEQLRFLQNTMTQNLGVLNKTLSEKIENSRKQGTSELEEKLRELQNAITQSLGALNVTLREKIENSRKEDAEQIEKRITEVQQNQSKALEDALLRLSDAMTRQVNESIASLNKEVQSSRQAEAVKLNETSEVLHDIVHGLNATLITKVGTLQHSQQQQNDQIHAEIADLQRNQTTKFNERLGELNHATTQRLRQLNDSLLGKIQESQETGYNRFKVEMQAFDDSLREIVQDLNRTYNEKIQNTQHRIGEHAMNLNETSEALHGIVHGLNATLNAKVWALRHSQRKKNDQIHATISEIQKNQTMEFNDKLKDLDDVTTQRLGQMNTSLLRKIDDSQKAGYKKCKVEMEAFDDSLRKNVEEVNSTCNEKIRNLQQDGKEYDRKLNETDEKLHAMIKNQIQEQNVTFVERVQKLVHSIRQENAQMNQRITQVQINQSMALNKKSQFLGDVMMRRFNDISFNVSQKVDELQQANININGSLKAELQVLENICKRRVEEMDLKMNETVHKLEQKNTKHTNRIDILQADVNELKSTLRMTEREHTSILTACIRQIELSQQQQNMDLDAVIEELKQNQSKALDDEIAHLKETGQERITAETARMTELLSAYEDQNRTFNERINYLMRNIQQLDGGIPLNGSNFQDKVLSLEADLNSAKTKISKNAKDIGRIRGTAMSAFFVVQVTSSTVKELGDDMKDLSRSMAGNDSTLVDAISDLNGKVVELENDLLQMKSGQGLGRSRRATPSQSMMRLVDGGPSFGRIEVYYRGEWGTICDDNWNIHNGNVVCKMLGYARASSVFTAAQYGAGTGKIWLDDVNCKGTESSILECGKSAWGVHNCVHSEDVSVRCEHV